jgi:hypothetical protein
MLFACAEDAAAEAVLSDARREAARSGDKPGMARVEIALADGARAQDNDPRAYGHLTTARRQIAQPPRSIASRVWIVEARLARTEGRAAPPWTPDDPDATQEELLDPGERIDLGAELTIERAIVARLARDWTAASALLERARELASGTSSPRLIALTEIEVALYTAEVGDPAAAAVGVRRAVDILQLEGLRRDAARAMIRLAELLTAKKLETENESAAFWLGRAKAVLGDEATWRDRTSIMGGFRPAGRPVPFDRAISQEAAASRVEAFDRARSALVAAIASSVDVMEGALGDFEGVLWRGGEPLDGALDRVRGAAIGLSTSASPAVGEVQRAVQGIVELLGGALAERDRLREQVSAFTEAAARTERQSRVSPLPDLAPKIALTDPAGMPLLTSTAPILPLVDLEKRAFLHAMEKSGQSVARAAEALGVSKVTFYAKLRSWGMHPRDRFDEEGPTNVRRQRPGEAPGPRPRFASETFEPPTRTAPAKVPPEK